MSIFFKKLTKELGGLLKGNDKKAELSFEDFSTQYDSLVEDFVVDTTSEEYKSFLHEYIAQSKLDGDKYDANDCYIDFVICNRFFGVDTDTYFKRKIYTYSIEEKFVMHRQDNKLRSKREMQSIRKLANVEDTTALEVVNKYESRIQELGILYYDFYNHGLYGLSNEQQLEETVVIKKIKRREAKQLEEIQASSGKTGNEIRRTIRRLNKDGGYKLTVGSFYDLELYEKSDEEILNIRNIALKYSLLTTILKFEMSEVLKGNAEVITYSAKMKQAYDLASQLITQTQFKQFEKVYFDALGANVEDKQVAIICDLMCRVFNISIDDYLVREIHRLTIEEQVALLFSDLKSSNEIFTCYNDEFKLVENRLKKYVVGFCDGHRLSYEDFETLYNLIYKKIDVDIYSEEYKAFVDMLSQSIDADDEEYDARDFYLDYVSCNQIFRKSLNNYFSHALYEYSVEEKYIRLANEDGVMPRREIEAIRKFAEVQGVSELDIFKSYSPEIHKLGISFADFYNDSLYELSPSMRVLRAEVLRKRGNRENDMLLEMAEVAGTTPMAIRRRISKINKARGSRVGIGLFRQLGLHMLTDEEINATLEERARISSQYSKLSTALKFKFDSVRCGESNAAALQTELDKMYEMAACLITDKQIEQLSDLYAGNITDVVSLDEMRRRAIDYDVTNRILGFSRKEYVAFGFADMSIEEKATYLPEDYKINMMAYLGNDETFRLLNDNFKTYELFEDDYHRTMIQVTDKDDFDEYKSFWEAHDEFVIKATKTSLSQTVELINTSDADMQNLFDRLVSSSNCHVLEEVIVPHEAITEINPDSQNIVRLVTYLDDGVTKFPYTTMHIGRNRECIENTGASDISVLVDSRTGTIISDGFEQNGTRFEKHPESDKAFKGYQLPYWDKALELGRRLSERVAENVFTGWDITLNDDGGWTLIEGIANPKLFDFQNASGKGAWKEFYNLFLKHKNIKSGEKLYLMPHSHLKEEKRNAVFNYIVDETGIPYEDVYYQAMRAKVYYDLPWFNFAQRMLILKDEDEWKKVHEARVAREKLILEEICEETEMSTEEVQRIFEQRNRKYGMPIGEYFSTKQFLMSDEELEKVYERKSDYSHSVLDKLEVLSDKSREELIDHMRKCRIKYSIKQNTYTTLQAYKLDDEKLDTYLMGIDQIYIMDKYNNPAYTKYFRSKDLFHEAFGEYTGRDVWVNHNTSLEEFIEFAKDKRKLFGKPNNSFGGQGTSVVEIEGDLEQLYEKLMAEPLTIYEEYIVQHKAMSEVYEGSLNTCRIVTINDGEPHVILSFVRFGNGGQVDNLSSGGMCAAVDVSNGHIITPAIDMHDNLYECHPISKVRFDDFTIPHWDKAIEMVKEASTKIPEVGFVGWDVAICEDKVLLVEGNDRSTLSGYQVCFAKQEIGQRYLVEPYL